MGKAYPLPPDTKPLLNGYKVPLTPIPNGFGYYGTIAYDLETKTYTQCFICGSFYKGLSAHLSNTHKKNNRSYRLEYGLGARVSLAAPNQKKIYRNAQGLDRLRKLAAHARTKITTEGRIRAATSPESLLQKNKDGRCPEQLIDKALRLREKLHHTPSRAEFIKEYGSGTVKSIRNTFGNWGEVKRLVEAQSD